LANGCEEIEALTTVDVLRRGGVEVITVSITGNEIIEGSHKIHFAADAILEEDKTAKKVADGSKLDLMAGDVLILPGGLQGTNALMAHAGVRDLLLVYRDENRLISAICAAPSVLGMNGLLKGKKATCYPGFEDKLLGSEPTGAGVVRDGNVITGKSMAYSQAFGLALLEALEGEEAAAKVSKAICMPE